LKLPDVREAIIAHDIVDKPALIVMDGNGIGRGIYQDTRRGLKHIVPGSAMEKVNAANLKTMRFNRALMNVYDGRVRIPASMPGLEILKRQKENAIFYSPGGCDIHDDLVCRFICGASVRYSLAARGRRVDAGDRSGRANRPKTPCQICLDNTDFGGCFRRSRCSCEICRLTVTSIYIDAKSKIIR
jgi:hypothetical protein